MRTRIISLLFSACSFVLGALNSHAQSGKITYTGEKIEKASPYYIQNLSTGNFIREPKVVETFPLNAKVYSVRPVNGKLQITNLTYDSSNATYTIASSGSNTWSYSYDSSTGSNVLYATSVINNRTIYYLLNSNADLKRLGALDENTPAYRWKMVSRDQVDAVEPDKIASRLSSQLGYAVTAKWQSDILTGKEGNAWGAYLKNATGICLNLGISGLKAGKYAVEFSGKSNLDKKSQVYVESLKGDQIINSCFKTLERVAKTYVIPIEVVSDGASLNVYVDAGLGKQDIWGIISGIRSIDDAEYKSLMTTWSPEVPKTSVDYYMFNQKTQYYLGAVNKTYRNISNATRFKMSGTVSTTGVDNAVISYNGGYLNDDNKWTSNSVKWDVKKASTNFGTNCYTIQKDGATNVLRCDGANNVTYPDEAANDNNVWQFISKEQYHAVYPTERIRQMLGQNSVVVERDFSSPFDVKKLSGNSSWFVTQNKVGVNNKYTITSLKNDSYIVEVYASKVGGNEASIVVNGQSMALSTSLESYTFNINVEDGKIELYEESAQGAGELSLAIKSIALEKDYVNQFISVFRGEKIENNRSYYINSIGGGNYVTSYRTSTKNIYDAAPFVFSQDNTKYRIASGQNYIGHNYESLTGNMSNWELTTPVNDSDYGYYYEIYHYWFDANMFHDNFGDNYCYWVNAQNTTLSMERFSKGGTHTSHKYHFRMISKEQYAVMFPQASIRQSLYNDNIAVTRENVESGLSMDNTKGTWLVKQTVTKAGDYIKITINNLVDDKYEIEMYGAMAGESGSEVRFVAHTGSDIIEWDDELSSELKSYKKTVEVKGGTLILYVKASEGVSAVYSAINSIKLFSETLDQDANSKIEWANETLKAGSFRLQNLRTKGFLVAPGSNGMQLNTANSTLFNITGSKTYISYDNDGVVNYAYQADGDGYWGVNPLYWTFVSQTGGYNIYSDNEKNRSRDRYIQYNEYGYLSYPRQSDNHYTNDRVWKLISQEQYETLAPIEIAKRYMSLGTGVRVSWEQNVIAEKVGDIWTAKSNPTKSGDYNTIVITGIEDGWYDIQMYADVSEGNSGKIVAKSNNHEASRTICGSAFYSYSLPVKVSGGTLTIYITVDGGWGSAWTAIKNIVPFKADKGVVDSYVKNAYFTIPQGNRDWDNKWTNVGFEPAIGSSETGLSGYAFHPEVKVKSNYLQKYVGMKGDVKISQNIELSRGTYVLSADAFTKGYNGILYAKVGDKEYTASCAGELANYKVEFDVNTETEVEIGFRKGEKWQDGETILAVDNFRLSFSDDYLKNPDFSEEDLYWTVAGMEYSPSHEGNMNVDKYVKSSNTQWNKVPAGKVYQKVTLPAGAYRFSASVFANNIMPRLFATIGSGSDARTQKTYIAHTGYNNGKEGQFYKEMVFVVPTACDVVVGLSYDATEYTTNVDVAVDNFHLVRLGDAENTEISCQIVNNAFTLGKNDALNKTYGWEKKTLGFREYGSNVAGIKYENNSATSAWKSYSVSQIVSGLPNGWYKIEAQGLYRDSQDATSAKALMFANGSYTDIPLYSGSATDNLATVSSAFANDPDLYMCDLVVHVDDGNIELGVKRENDNGKITINADLTVLNFVKLYYLYEENVFADVTYFIKNPSFETGNTLKWKLGNLDNVKATKTTDSRWDKSYYYGASSTKSGLRSLSQTIEGLPAGEYEISVQVQAVTSGTKVSLYGNVGNELSDVIASSTSTGVVTISGRVEIQEGDNLTIGVGSTGNFNVDNFVLSKSSADVYLYNVEAGAFFGKQIESGYSVVEKDWGKPVGFDSEGTLIRMTKSDDDITFKNMSGEYIEVKRLYGSTEDFKYTFYNANPNADTHHKFRMNQIDNSNFCNFSVDPADGKFGTKSPVENAGAARQYHGTYGVTYLGWGGEDGFDVLLPLIPRADSLYRGVTWQVLTQKQYETYGATIKAAHAARMAAWPILCSARRSKLQVDYTQFEHVYNNIASTAEEISAYATTVQNKLLSGNTLNAATEQNYVDLTFLMDDADCNQKNITWNNAEGVFKSSETSEYTSEKAFSGRRYTAFDTEKLANTEFTCELNGLPYGRYMISLMGSAYANNNEVKNAYFFVRNNYGDVERQMGTAAFSIQNVVTPKFSVDANNPSVTIGVKLYDTNAKYVSIDDIRILYLGDTNSDVYNYGYISENGVLKLLGAWPEEPEAENYMKYVLGSNTGVSAIVLNAPNFTSEFEVVVDCSKYTNKNLLVYKDSEQPNISVINKATNLVEDGNCKNLVLVDKYDIAIPSAFTAKKASYSRSVTTNYGTLCLPFEYSVEDGNIKLFKFADFENDNGTFKIGLEETSEIAAGKPCIFKRADSNVKTMNINVNRGVDVVVSAGVTKNSQGYELRGSYKAVTFGDTSGKDKTAANDYYYIAKDKFWHATDYFSISAFRAYIYAGDKRITDLNINEARSFVLREITLDAEQNETTAIDDVDDDVTIVGYYNTNGQQIDKPTSGVVIVKYSDGSSRKVLVK